MENQIIPPKPLKFEFTSFGNLLLTFDWLGFASTTSQSDNKNLLSRKQLQEIDVRQENLMRLITPHLAKEPLVTINTSCLPPVLTPPVSAECQGHGNVFKGRLRSGSPPKIGILVQFGFGVDVLEIYLNEVYDQIDRFFLVESTRAHFRTIKKPLLWEHVKDQPRFRKFSTKIIHLVIDDAETAHASKVFEANVKEDKKFEMEGVQEHLRWTKFLEWNAANEYFSNKDLIGIGDADEIPSRYILHMLKHCEVNINRFDIGIWFAYGNINYAFKGDWPVPDHPYSLGDPTFWTLEAALDYARTVEPPLRMRGTTGRYLLGGIHMTHSGYLPFQIARRISCSECWPFLPSEIAFVLRNLKNGNLRAIEIKLAAVPKELLRRNKRVEEVRNELEGIAMIPWFYDCNRDRYPTWEGSHDTRLD